MKIRMLVKLPTMVVLLCGVEWKRNEFQRRFRVKSLKELLTAFSKYKKQKVFVIGEDTWEHQIRLNNLGLLRYSKDIMFFDRSMCLVYTMQKNIAKCFFHGHNSAMLGKTFKFKP